MDHRYARGVLSRLAWYVLTRRQASQQPAATQPATAHTAAAGSSPEAGGVISPRRPNHEDAPARPHQASSPERRKTARFLLHDLRGTITWTGRAGEANREVSVLNISGAGAAVLSEDSPEVGGALRLSLHGESAGMEPVAAQVVNISADPSGKRVLHLRFARWVPLDSILPKYRERRLWERYPARETGATLSWVEGATAQTIRCDLLNISGGGAAVVSNVLPPPGVSVWLELEAGASRAARIDPVESRLVMTSIDPSGLRIAHLQFVAHCPMDLFNLAVNGLAGEETAHKGEGLST